MNSFLTEALARTSLNIGTIIILFLIIFGLPFALGPRLKTNPVLCAFVMIIRTVIFYFMFRVIVHPVYFRQITQFISLVFSLYLMFTVFAWTLKGNYRRRRASLWLVIWLGAIFGLLFLLKEENFLRAVSVAFLYGLYLIYEMGFILEGDVYQTDFNQCIFGAFTLQYDLMGIFNWFIENCDPDNQNGRRRN